MPWAGPAYLVGDTTSKQNLRSTSSQGFTEQSRRSSTTTVSTSCGHDRRGPRAQHPPLPHPDHPVHCSTQDTDCLGFKWSLSLATQAMVPIRVLSPVIPIPPTAHPQARGEGPGVAALGPVHLELLLVDQLTVLDGEPAPG